jgi:Raf kinase inhibitor-like YbhB/YbcL family protein
MRRVALSALALLAFAGAALAQTTPAGAPAAPGRGGPRPPPLVLTSPAYEDGGIVPDKYTQKAPQPAPSIPFAWTGTPAGTQSFVLMLHDLDVVTSKTLADSLHWLAWNIPPTATSMPEGVPNVAGLPDGTVQITHRGTIGFVAPGWNGPNYHHYTAELFALDTTLPLPTTATRDEVMAAANGHILARAALAGRFRR